jgi:membrane carboxypeptidase/penicillin-binding protein
LSEALKTEAIADFPVPEGVVFVKIDAETGLLASPYSKETVFQAFKGRCRGEKVSRLKFSLLFRNLVL